MNCNYLSGDDLLHMEKQGESSTYTFNLSGSYNSFKQSPLSTLSYGFVPRIKTSKELSDTTSSTEIKFNIPFKGSQYFSNDYIGPHLFYDGTLDLSIKNDQATNPLDLFLGFGYGRITSARPLAQAVVISEELGANLNNGQLMNVADIIGKSSSGYYTNQYKTDASIHYYNDLAEATGAGQKIMKMQQILSNPAYANISDRFTGTQIRIGFENTFLQDFTSAGNLIIDFQYAKPLGMKKQLYSGLAYNTPLDEGIETTAKAFVRYAIDHTFTWTSRVDAVVDMIMPDGGEAYSILDLKLSTTRVTINTLTATGELNFIKAGDNNDPFIAVNVRFNYFLF